MVPTHRQVVRALQAGVLAFALGGCTFDEDELHGLPEAGVEVAEDAADVAAMGPLDGGAVDSGAPTVTRPDAGAVDAGVDAAVRIDVGSAVDGQVIDGVAADAVHAPLAGPDVGIGLGPIDAPAIDVSAVDSAAVDLSRTETALRDGL